MRFPGELGQASLVREGSDVAWGFAWNVGGPCVSGCKLVGLMWHLC